MKVFVVKILFLQLATAKSAAKLGIFFDMTKEKAGNIFPAFSYSMLGRCRNVLLMC